MAGLECNNCGFGIHYHDEPNGVGYEDITYTTWNMFKDTDLPIVRYTLDGPQDYVTIWKCLECGCMHVFEANSNWVKKAYVPYNYNIFHKDYFKTSPKGIRYYLFSDLVSEPIWEDDLTAREYEKNKKYPRCDFAVINDEFIYVFSDRECTDVIRGFKAIEPKYKVEK